MMFETYVLGNTVGFWSTAWLWVLIVGGCGFLCILVYAVITGAADIRDLFATLRRGEANSDGTETKVDTTKHKSN